MRQLTLRVCVLLLLAVFLFSGCRTVDSEEGAPDPGDLIWEQEGASFLGEGSSKLLLDVESAIGEYVQQPPLTMGALGDNLPMVPSYPRGVVGIPEPEADEQQLVIMPLPFIDATIGAGMGLSIGLVRKPTSGQARPRLSVMGLGGFASLNGSWGVGAGYRSHSEDGEYRFLVGAGLGRIRYDFFGVGTAAGDDEDPAELEQRVFGATAHALKRIADGWYLGPRQLPTTTRGPGPQRRLRRLVRRMSRSSVSSMRGAWGSASC